MTEKVFLAGVLATSVNDETADDSDKSFTPGAGVTWDIFSIVAELTSTATVGNRQMTLQILDGTDVVFASKAAAVQAASLVRTYVFSAGGGVRDSAFVDGVIECPLPANLAIGSGHTIKVFDSAAVDAAADDMNVRILGRELRL